MNLSEVIFASPFSVHLGNASYVLYVDQKDKWWKMVLAGHHATFTVPLWVGLRSLGSAGRQLRSLACGSKYF